MNRPLWKPLEGDSDAERVRPRPTHLASSFVADAVPAFCCGGHNELSHVACRAGFLARVRRRRGIDSHFVGWLDLRARSRGVLLDLLYQRAHARLVRVDATRNRRASLPWTDSPGGDLLAAICRLIWDSPRSRGWNRGARYR